MQLAGNLLTPGVFGLAHESPLEVMPTSTGLSRTYVNSGPPESPWQESRPPWRRPAQTCDGSTE